MMLRNDWSQWWVPAKTIFVWSTRDYDPNVHRFMESTMDEAFQGRAKRALASLYDRNLINFEWNWLEHDNEDLEHMNNNFANISIDIKNLEQYLDDYNGYCSKRLHDMLLLTNAKRNLKIIIRCVDCCMYLTWFVDWLRHYYWR